MLMDSITRSLIRLALEEDIGSGDVTSQFFVREDSRSQGHILAKDSGIIAGLKVVQEVFREVDPRVNLTLLVNDGDMIRKGVTVLRLAGPTRSILTAERTALNFLQRLSGVATQTRRYVEALGNSHTRLLDTRKTTPGWRRLEKAAVLAGGGHNHRMGLYDMVMAKDNHLLAEGRLPELQRAIDSVKEAHPGMKVELEADRVPQVEKFLTLRGVDVILLDNMSLEDMQHSVKLTDGRVKLEASGGVTLERLKDIAATGVDYISCGALTHSAKALDLSLDLEELSAGV